MATKANAVVLLLFYIKQKSETVSSCCSYCYCYCCYCGGQSNLRLHHMLSGRWLMVQTVSSTLLVIIHHLPTHVARGVAALFFLSGSRSTLPFCYSSTK